MSDSETENLPVAAPTTANFLAVISKAASDPNTDVAKMHGLLDVQERMMNKQAEIDFNQSLFRAQSNMPRVQKNGAIKNRDGKVVAKYMLFEDIDAAIREIYEAEGFCIMDSQKENANGTITIYSTLAHRGGHSKTIECTVPKDKENALKTSLQAAVGTVTTGKRINTCNFFRIVAEDDTEAEKFVASRAAPLTDQQATIIKDLIRETGTDTQRFLATMVSGAKSVDEIGMIDFNRIYNALLAKRNKAKSEESNV